MNQLESYLRIVMYLVSGITAIVLLMLIWIVVAINGMKKELKEELILIRGALRGS